MTEFHAFAPGLHGGGQPTRAELARLGGIGVRSVVNLRPPAEDPGFDEAAEAAALGLDYACLPVAGADDLDDATVARFGALLEAGQARGDVLIHCASGNRVGALVALHARGTGATPDEALALGKAAGLAGLEPAVRARLDATP